MIIRDIHIEQFGFYRNRTFDNLQPGLNLLIGDNEAGKTSLMQFIRWMFFGEALWIRGENKYEPQEGLLKSGRMVLVTDNGDELILERKGKKGTGFLNGKALTEETVRNRYLKHLTPTLYRQVFALTLDELQGIQFLKDGKANEFFTIAGAGPGAREAMELLKRNQNTMEKLLKPSGTRPKLNQIMNELKESSKKLKSYNADQQKYLDLKRELEEVSVNIEQLANEMKKTGTSLNHQTLLKEVNPLLIRLDDVKEKLKPLENAKRYKPGQLEYFMRLKEDKQATEKQQNDLQKEIETIELKREQIRTDDRIWEAREKISSLEQESLQARQLMQEMEEINGKMNVQQELVHDKVKELGYGVEEEQVAAMTTDLENSRQLQEFLSRKRSLEQEILECDQNKRQQSELQEKLNRRQRQLKNEIEEINRTSAIHDEVDLDTVLKHTEKYRRHLSEIERMETDLDNLTKASTENHEELTGVHIASRRLHYLGAGLLSIFFVLFVLLGMLQVFPSSMQNYEPVIIGLGGSMVVFWLIAARYLKRSEKRLQKKLELLESETIDKETQLNNIQRLAGEVLSFLGLEDSLSKVDTENVTKILLSAQSNLRKREYLQRQLMDLQNELQEVQRTLERVEDHRQSLLAKQKKLNSEWKAWLDKNHYPNGLKMGEMDTFLRAIAAIQTYQKELSGMQDLTDKKGKWLKAFSRKLSVLFDELELEKPNDPESQLLRLQQLVSDLSLEERNRDQLKQLEIRLDALAKQHKKIDEKIHQLEGDLEKCLKEVGCETESDLFTLQKEHETYQERNQELDLLQSKLKTLVTREEDLEKIRSELAQLSSEEIDYSIREFQLRSEELEQHKVELLTSKGRLQKELDIMENKENIGRELQTQATLEHQRDEQLQEYLTLYLSNHFIQTARKKYEQERQPGLFKRANEILMEMTECGYRLLLDLEENALWLETTDRKRLPAHQWSSGMADQVYLALRLAMVEHYYQQSTQIPVLLDDILVRFDVGRTEKSARFLSNWSKQTQIIFFTCHPNYSRIFEKMAQIRVVSLQ